ncbi:hypothetical protein HBI56_079940 [Parastagonospora nodorum]|nr:hypothetical protein HBH53_057560 [Parastagonospora nodorum]KAH4049517.1 hypothetical protein HBH49_147730 [Parastagonospora nodorum]KAH4067515.1 hypothetical protein HBH50_128220 [Parastagonospora nodorum]KAH4086614.1 hypothetical protein HBH48_137640 [Parastagonospora nodorum]KAH4122591.1 hypothetical protein HBH47_085330 [Parastagonospora nodorum]
MSGSNNPTGSSTTAANTVSDPHINGHLVSTGSYEVDGVTRLYIHKSRKCISSDHICQVFSYDAQTPGILDMEGPSADFMIEEHGWFRDVTTFEQICNTHPMPNDQSPEENFTNWRNSLLVFLDSHHGGAGGQWTRAN